MGRTLKYFWYTLLLFIIIALIVSCKDEHNESGLQTTGLNYVIFSDSSIWYDSIISINIDSPSDLFDTLVQVRKTVVDSIISKKLNSNIYCSRYLLIEGDWKFLNRFWFEKSPKKMLRFEDNQVWLDFVFPIRQGVVWNSYAYNIESDTTLINTVTQFDNFGRVNGNMYDSLMEIQHQMDSNLIYKRTDQSYYVAGIGFLYREAVNIVSDEPSYDYTLPIDKRIKTATKLIIKRYKNER